MIRLLAEILFGGGAIGAFTGWCLIRYLDWRTRGSRQP